LSGALLGPSLPGHSVIWGQTFREALIKALENSRLFAEVLRDGKSRYVLRAEIIQQATAAYGGTITTRYTLNDTLGHHDLWSEDITASYSFTLNSFTFFSPGNTEYQALMRACGKNIGLLIAKLGALPTTEKAIRSPAS
jgi:hypothetical protein